MVMSNLLNVQGKFISEIELALVDTNKCIPKAWFHALVSGFGVADLDFRFGVRIAVSIIVYALLQKDYGATAAREDWTDVEKKKTHGLPG